MISRKMVKSTGERATLPDSNCRVESFSCGVCSGEGFNHMYKIIFGDIMGGKDKIQNISCIRLIVSKMLTFKRLVFLAHKWT